MPVPFLFSCKMPVPFLLPFLLEVVEDGELVSPWGCDLIDWDAVGWVVAGVSLETREESPGSEGQGGR